MADENSSTKVVIPQEKKPGGVISAQNSAQPVTTQELKPAPPPKSK